MDALRVLTQSGANSGNIEATTKAVEDLAGMLGGDLASAAFYVGKALQGEFDSFSRLGIVLDEHMSAAQKLTKLYEVLAERGGGQLRAANETTLGSMKRLKNGFSDLFEGIGSVIVKTIPLKEATAALGNGLSALGGVMNQMPAASDKLKNGLGTAGEAIDDTATRARKLSEELDKTKQKATESADALNAFLKLKDEQTESKISERQAQRDAKLAVINEAEKRGALSPVEAEQRRQVENENFEKFKLDTTNAAATDKSKQLRLEAAENQKPIDDARKKQADAEKRLQDLKTAADAQAGIRAKHAPLIQAAQDALNGQAEFDDVMIGDVTVQQRRPQFELAKRALEEAKHKQEDELAANPFGKVVTPKMIADQDTLTREAKKYTEGITREFGPRVADESAEAARLDRGVGLRNRVERANRVARDIANENSLRSARGREIGTATRGDDGSIRGTPQAVSIESQIQADRQRAEQIRSGAGGDQRAAAIIQFFQRQHETNDRVIGLLTRSQSFDVNTLARLRALEDQNRVLEGMIRNAAGR
jgi:hypothetical protein